MIGVSIALALLFGLLTLVSYVDRLYQEIGKFLSRDFQDNIDAFEQIVEPRLGVTRAARLALHGHSDATGHRRHRHDRRLHRVPRPRLERLRSPRSHAQPGADHHLLQPPAALCLFFANPRTLAGGLGAAFAPADLSGSAGDAGARILPVRRRADPRARRRATGNPLRSRRRPDRSGTGRRHHPGRRSRADPVGGGVQRQRPFARR